LVAEAEKRTHIRWIIIFETAVEESHRNGLDDQRGQCHRAEDDGIFRENETVGYADKK